MRTRGRWRMWNILCGRMGWAMWSGYWSAIGAGSSTEAALREVLHSDYGDVMKSTAEFLRGYGR